MTETKRKAVFIDRDGTLIEEVNFLSRIEDLRLFSFTADAVRLFKENGFLAIIVTNQSGIARKLYDEPAMHAIHDRIQNDLTEKLDGFYFCPHLPGDGCDCRKPNLGMIEAACADFNIDLEGSWMIGDKEIDVQTGINAGIRTAMVLTGYGSVEVDDLKQKPDLVEENLLAAAEKIVKRGS